MTLDLEKMAREFVIAHQPEPLKCIHCGRNQYTGTICSAMAMELCPYSPTKSGHAYQIEITTEAAMFQTEVKRLVSFARSVQKASEEGEHGETRILRWIIENMLARLRDSYGSGGCWFCGVSLDQDVHEIRCPMQDLERVRTLAEEEG